MSKLHIKPFCLIPNHNFSFLFSSLKRLAGHQQQLFRSSVTSQPTSHRLPPPVSEQSFETHVILNLSYNIFTKSFNNMPNGLFIYKYSPFLYRQQSRDTLMKCDDVTSLSPCVRVKFTGSSCLMHSVVALLYIKTKLILLDSLLSKRPSSKDVNVRGATR